MKKVMSVKAMLDWAIQQYFKYNSEEIIVVNLTSQECFTGNTPADFFAKNPDWNFCWDVEVTSIRNDNGHISVTFNDTVEE